MQHFINLADISNEYLESIILFALKIKKSPDEYYGLATGCILATLFFEPSTRTRLSFESAMLRLGGQVISVSDASSSSTKKGETPEDTCRMAGIYSDILAVRHPVEYTPQNMSYVSSVPVINAGDGSNEHPTQTLADLITIYERFGRLDNLTIAFCGDLKYGRTVHSLMQALDKYPNNKFIFISPDELKMPKKYIDIANTNDIIETADLENIIPDIDVLYMTRVQQERFDDIAEYEKLKGHYILTKSKLNLAKKNMIVMHPLPRVDEISTDVDSDERAWYFKQAEFALFGRMALIIDLLDLNN